MTGRNPAYYMQILRLVLPENRENREKYRDHERIAAEVLITGAQIGINRQTKDLEFRVSGELQLKNGETRKGDYRISFPLWNYSESLEEKGISKETYQEVMAEEQELLLAKYIRAWVTLSEGGTEQITRKELLEKELECITVEYHPLVQELITYQAKVYVKMKTRQAERERIDVAAQEVILTTRTLPEHGEQAIIT